ncbi:MAG TPA: ATP-dependent DNA helicase RecG [Methylomusa anaerophila]|uniref:ATP-dependent DNA helicase RecG n=1 Tax=Methylomusa anaerophila TaxID=1930071 RepID=A0A348APQ1_9FIRM|nr:ATP-dependent DNA helicase RecG [Methylomusa anaerophila]BBB93049.1 ATP-dependent DNA helicase RecG [Methylomusa anaerophila]HML87117.1 ATP-dependent DNA helicase RecG [Methylomusa anaerophila]
MSTNIKFLKGVGPANAVRLSKLNIFTVGDLLTHFPRRYEDRSQIKLVGKLTDGEYATIHTIVINVRELKPNRRLTIIKLSVRDESGMAFVTWFNQSYMKNKFKPGMELIISGKVQKKQFGVEFNKPEVELAADFFQQPGHIIPVYPATENISQWQLRSLIRQTLNLLTSLSESSQDSLPREITAQFNIIDPISALNNIHFPADHNALAQARRRIVFEELYLLQCGLSYLKYRNKHESIGIKHAPDGDLTAAIEKNLPFELTKDQLIAVQEIKSDMEEAVPMQRLVQGDVGSGKTVVAAIALTKTVENGFQGAMMAPTEILAEQHYHSLARLLAPHGVRLSLLTGSLTGRTREKILFHIREGLIDIVVGTHALIQDDVVFKHLGLVVTDEQHRFGVRQRACLQAKGSKPDVLVMTATPIPRTMALTVYGDLDVSIIRQMPPGRKPVATYVRSSDRREKVYRFATDQIKAGRQVYVVCPLVEESEKLEGKSAVTLYEELSNSFFRGIPCGLVHGKMKSADKEKVMTDFYHGNLKALISTTVIEVGVNVPNATVMIIENADRFGLAQLHQLRGRVGRGEDQSYCILLSDGRSAETRERLNLMVQVADGFKLAEQDLIIRGPGQFFGTNQHGLPDLKAANIVKDVDILLEARRAAELTIKKPELFMQLKEPLSQLYKNNFDLYMSH